MTERDWNYNRDGLNKEELAKLKKAFLASMPKELRKKTKYFRCTQEKCKITGSCGATYFVDKPFGTMPDRLHDKSRVVDTWGNQMMIRLGNDINPNGVGDGKEPRVARTYTINASIKTEIIPYRCRYSHTTEVFKVYVYARSIEEAIQTFWDKFERAEAKWKRQ